jgi:hypothetical protein
LLAIVLLEQHADSTQLVADVKERIQGSRDVRPLEHVLLRFLAVHPTIVAQIVGVA